MRKSPPIFRSESRILGLDTCNPHVIIGAVLRGGLYLDGVLTFSPNLKADQLTSKINGTKYRPELRAIMTHDPRTVLNSTMIRRMTSLPILNANAMKNGRLRSQRRLGQTRGQERNRATPLKSTVDQILSVRGINGRLAEPVRIAHLLAKLEIFGRILQEKR